MGRMVDPAEVADVVGFLLSHAARAITGVNLPVDAGWLVGSTWTTYGGFPLRVSGISRVTSRASPKVFWRCRRNGRRVD
jgi:hypothetical protein